jgi:hypothetical protein
VSVAFLFLAADANDNLGMTGAYLDRPGFCQGMSSDAFQGDDLVVEGHGELPLSATYYLSRQLDGEPTLPMRATGRGPLPLALQLGFQLLGVGPQVCCTHGSHPILSGGPFFQLFG